MVHSVEGLRNIKKENGNKLLQVKSLIPSIRAVQKKRLG